MPEVHIVGEIEGASGFPSNNLFCKWKIVTNADDSNRWERLEGETEGQTQVDFPKDGEMAVWSHPVDVHFRTTSPKGWPRLSVQVWSQDMFQRNELVGYGFCYIPTSAGIYELEVVTWRPSGSVYEEITSFFLGGTPQLRNDELVVSGADRYRLKTVSAGKVYANLTVVFKDFAQFGIY